MRDVQRFAKKANLERRLTLLVVPRLLNPLWLGSMLYHVCWVGHGKLREAGEIY